MDAVAELRAVRYRYPGAPRDALAGVDLRLQPGELVLLWRAPAGPGKSSLLRALCALVPHFHGGRFSGRAIVDGLDTRSAPPGAVCARAGLVFQDPEAGAVMLTVEREVAFGLENAGVAPAVMLGRVREALAAGRGAALAGPPPRQLSGGELQRVALASALAPGPPLLLLDEPTSQLDPDGADALVAHLRELCDDVGVCVVVADHRTDRLVAAADRVVLMEAGLVVADGAPGEVELPPASPPPAAQSPGGGELARTADRHRGWLPGTPGPARRIARPAGRDRDHAHRTERRRQDDARPHPGRAPPPSAGRVRPCGEDVTTVPAERRFPRVGYVGQDPGRYLLHEHVYDEVAWALELRGTPAAVRDRSARHGRAAARPRRPRRRHPRDLSGGERERVALASVIVAEPRVLVLDEPTRGMDAASKQALAALLREHAASGGASLVVTHDAGFAAAPPTARRALRTAT